MSDNGWTALVWIVFFLCITTMVVSCALTRVPA